MQVEKFMSLYSTFTDRSWTLNITEFNHATVPFQSPQQYFCVLLENERIHLCFIFDM